MRRIAGGPDMRKLRIVVIDDDQTILRLFQDYFDGDTYEVVTSRKPVVCPILDTSKNVCPGTDTCADAVITDYHMPGMNGLQLIREQIRAGCKLAPQNRALMTGTYDEEMRRETEKLGCARFEKPFSFSELKSWLDECATRVDLSKPLPPLRREPRRTIDRMTARMTEHSGERRDAVVVNVSDSGLCIELNRPLAVRKTVHIESGTREAPRFATVRWSAETETGRYRAGLSYSSDA
jgi:CheY-like chemotaxis protein